MVWSRVIGVHEELTLVLKQENSLPIDFLRNKHLGQNILSILGGHEVLRHQFVVNILVH